MIYFLINFVECELEKEKYNNKKSELYNCLYNINKCRFLFTFINKIVNFFFV